MKISNRAIVLLIIGLIIFLMGYRAYHWSLDHYEYMTTGEVTGAIVHNREAKIAAVKCLGCHAFNQIDGFLVQYAKKDYSSPYNLAVSTDRRKLFVTGQESAALYIYDLTDNQLISTVPVGDHPHSVAVTKDGQKAFVTNQWSDNVSVIDVENGVVEYTIQTGGGPAGLVLDQNEEFLYVANTYTSNVSVINLNQGIETARLRSGNYPTGINLSPDGRQVLVVSQRSVLVEYREPPKTEITVISTGNKRVQQRKYFEEAHIMEKVDFTPTGDLAFTTLVRPRNLVPAVQVENGWMMTFALGVISIETGKMYQLPLDEPKIFYADPYDVRITPDGKRAFISHSGGDFISVVDVDKVRDVIREIDEGLFINAENDLMLSDAYVIKRIPSGSNPKGMVISPDGSYLYVAERLSDNIAVLNTATLEYEQSIPMKGAGTYSLLRRGEQLFNHSGRTFQNQYSCYSCHPDNHEDGLTYDMDFYPGEDLSNVQTLRELAGTSPFKWNGNNVSIYMQCGMRFSTFVTRTEAYTPYDLNALVGHITSQISHPPNLYRTETGELTEAQKRGKEIFERTRTNDGRVIAERDRCITCHPAPNFSDFLKHDVGTATDRDNHTEFLTPNLNNIYESAPYLHDGRANTLEELWTVYNDDDLHGVANDMTKDQLNDLIEYLLSLGSARHYK
jgi:YVTN family beta-propeller protein